MYVCFLESQVYVKRMKSASSNEDSALDTKPPEPDPEPEPEPDIKLQKKPTKIRLERKKSIWSVKYIPEKEITLTSTQEKSPSKLIIHFYLNITNY